MFRNFFFAHFLLRYKQVIINSHSWYINCCFVITMRRQSFEVAYNPPLFVECISGMYLPIPSLITFTIDTILGSNDVIVLTYLGQFNNFWQPNLILRRMTLQKIAERKSKTNIVKLTNEKKGIGLLLVITEALLSIEHCLGLPIGSLRVKLSLKSQFSKNFVKPANCEI